MRYRSSRAGFTLIEIIAAIAIASVLLAAVYGTLTFMLRSIQIGKEAVASMQIIRGTTIRISTDIRKSLALTMSTPSIVDALAAASGSQSGSSGSTSSSGSTPGGSSSSSTIPPTQFNLGLQGDLQSLTIYASREPRYSILDADVPNGVFSDLRIISYTLTPDGLVRQEISNVLSGAPELTSQPEIIAPEVKDLQFQYFDQNQATWVQQWDGSLNGPPAAVEVTITVQMPGDGVNLPPPPVQHRFVVGVPAFGSPIPQDLSSMGGAQ